MKERKTTVEKTNTRKRYLYKDMWISVPEAAKIAGVSVQTIYNRLNANGGDIEAAINANKGNDAEIEAACDAIMDIVAPAQPDPAAEPAPVKAEPNIPLAWKADLRKYNTAITALFELMDTSVVDDVAKDAAKAAVEALYDARARAFAHHINWHELAKQRRTTTNDRY